MSKNMGGFLDSGNGRWLLFSLLLLSLMISSQSLWIDEGDTAVYAIAPGPADWLRHLLQDVNADCQMPLTMFLAWLGTQVMGSSEWLLRLPNFFWGLGTLAALYFIGKKQELPFLPFLMAVQPYFWFYTDQARPYAALMCGGAWLLYGIQDLWLSRGHSNTWVLPTALSAIALCHMSILAPVVFMAFGCVTLLLSFRQPWQWQWRPFAKLACWLSLCLPIGGYYLWTVLKGAKGAQLWEIGPKNLAFIIYELGGMTGLGPPVREIRSAAQSHQLATLIAPWWPGWVGIAVLGLALLSLVFLWLKKDVREKKTTSAWPLFAVVLFSTVLFFLLGFLLNKAFWARHLAPVFPVLILGMALVFKDARRVEPAFARWAGAGVLTLWLVSSFSIRFNPAHRNDDYRSAAAAARAELDKGGVVWWSGSWHCAAYYGLPVDSEGVYHDPRFVEASFKGRDWLEARSKPSLIIVTRPQIYDPHGDLGAMAQESGYVDVRQFSGFVLLRQ